MSDDELTLHQRRGGNNQFADNLSDEEEEIQYSTKSEIKNEEKSNQFVRNIYNFRLSQRNNQKKSEPKKF
jgi:hypothetical protein